MSPSNLASILVLAACGSTSPAPARPDTTEPVPTTTGDGFRYDAATGTCVDGAGQVGLNPVRPEALFAGHDEASNSYAEVDAECVDFSGFDFGPHIGASYPTLAGWNLRGARFAGASFLFANMTDADLRGADLRDIKIGYTKIAGTGDPHTQLGGDCEGSADHAIWCSR